MKKLKTIIVVTTVIINTQICFGESILMSQYIDNTLKASNTNERRSQKNEKALEKAKTLEKKGLLQEAAWIYDELGYDSKSNELLSKLESLLRSKPLKIERFGKQTTACTYVVTFKDGITGFFKINESERYSYKNEIAAYAIDQVLDLNITPLTIEAEYAQLQTEDCVHANSKGQKIKGSLMYFVQDAGVYQTLQAYVNDYFDGTARNPADPIFALIIEKLFLFDILLANLDRHVENILKTKAKEIIAIDHNRTMEFNEDLYNTSGSLTIDQFIEDILTLNKRPDGLNELINVPAKIWRDILEKVYLTSSNSSLTHTQEEVISGFMRRRSLILNQFKDTVFLK